jgi:hypothetical protein
MAPVAHDKLFFSFTRNPDGPVLCRRCCRSAGAIALSYHGVNVFFTAAISREPA